MSSKNNKDDFDVTVKADDKNALERSFKPLNTEEKRLLAIKSLDNRLRKIYEGIETGRSWDSWKKVNDLEKALKSKDLEKKRQTIKKYEIEINLQSKC